MDKIFNLKIDAKNKNITTINGFKQFDNNSVLNITLLQNNLALDLSNCTVRLNFLREDERILLYMADIVSAKEGKVSIKLSPEVLKKTGNVKADISVFDSNLLKITSATFNLRVEKSIYNDTYFTDKDLDLMQQEYAREKERQKAESARSENELERITKEGQRNSNENTRNYNEEARKKAESARVAEWNNVKKDATNIKNTLDTTIDTANKTKDNLQNTIDKADTTTYASKGDIKTLTTQYEDNAKQLKTVEVEGGTWIPTLYGSTVAGTNEYTVTKGYYKKIGKRVFAEGYITIKKKDTSMSGEICIGGLPFKSKNDSPRTYGVTFCRMENINASFLTGRIIDNSNYISLYKNGITNLTDKDISDSLHISFSMNYEID